MVSIWVESLGRNFESALGMLEGAIRDCTDQRWDLSMWEVPAPDAGRDLRGPEGDLVTDPDSRRSLVQRRSTPWAVAWHALEVADYDLTGDFAPWSPPPLIAGKAHWRDVFTITAIPGHTIEHASQIRQFITAALYNSVPAPQSEP
jgi:hypothetical protein